MKNYVLDTNVLLHDPQSLLSFEDNHVLLPIEVIEEVDRFKRESSERGQNARTVSRMLDALRAQGRLSEGVPLSNLILTHMFRRWTPRVRRGFCAL